MEKFKSLVNTIIVSKAIKESHTKTGENMIPYLNGKPLQRSLLKWIREELLKRGYSEKAIKEILKWYE